MRTRTNVRAARWLALLLVMVGLMIVQVKADKVEQITISQRTYNCKWGTVTIPTQTIWDTPSAEIKFEVSDIPSGFAYKCLLLNGGEQIDRLENRDFQEMKSMAVVVVPRPINSATDFVNVLNGFEPGCAYQNANGEVVLTKNIFLTGPDDYLVEEEPWLVRTNLTLLAEEPESIGYIPDFDIEIENSRFTMKGAGIRFSVNLKITDGVLECMGTMNGIRSIETKGDVLLRGLLEEGIDSPCSYGFPWLNVKNADFTGSNVTVEDLYIACYESTSIPSGTVLKMKNSAWYDSGIILNGGELSVDSCLLYTDAALTVESGTARINHSKVSENVLVKGTDANVEIDEGVYQGFTIREGNVSFENGYISGPVTMEGGSLEVNDGAITSIVVNNSNCDIALNKGLFGSVYMPSGVNKSISSLLGGNARYYDRDGTYMFYDLGFTVERVPRTEYSQIVGYTYPISFVRSERGDVVVPPAAFVAAQEASVGPNGTDVRVRENGDLEIWTPEGLAWLAFLQSDTHDRVRNGRDYLDESGDWYLMADLDMSDYGAGWPDLSIPGGKVFDGQRHRIYNMHVLKPDASFLKEVNGTVANLVVEGSVTNSEDEGGRLPKGDASWSYVLYNVSGFAQINKGTIINCAFKGGVWNAVPGYSYINGFVQTNVGEIKNCYATPCEELIGGARYDKDHLNNEYVCPTEHHWVSGFVHTNASLAVIDNCYYAGKLVFDYVGSEVDAYLARDISKVYDEEPMIEHFYYMESDIHVDTLNANVRDNTSVDYAPWSEWAVSEDKQCGHPYFVWETALYDPSVANEVVDVADDFQVWSEPGTLCFHSARAADVVIYSLRGVLRGRYDRHVGVKRVALPKGVYLVVYGTDARKVVVN